MVFQPVNNSYIHLKNPKLLLFASKAVITNAFQLWEPVDDSENLRSQG